MWTFSENSFSTIRGQIEQMIGFASIARNDQTLKHGLTNPELVDSFTSKYRRSEHKGVLTAYRGFKGSFQTHFNIGFLLMF